MGRVRAHLRSNVIGYLALFVALSGSAFAVTQIDRNSVRSRHIVHGQVRGIDVAKDTLTGRNVRDGSLARVPNAAVAQSAADANSLDGKDSTDFATSHVEDWNNVGDADGPPFYAEAGGCDSWANWDPTDSSVTAFFRDAFGIVHLRGRLDTPGSGSSCPTMFTLPPGYRPPLRETFAPSSVAS